MAIEILACNAEKKTGQFITTNGKKKKVYCACITTWDIDKYETFGATACPVCKFYPWVKR